MDIGHAKMSRNDISRYYGYGTRENDKNIMDMGHAKMSKNDISIWIWDTRK